MQVYTGKIEATGDIMGEAMQVAFWEAEWWVFTKGLKMKQPQKVLIHLDQN